TRHPVKSGSLDANGQQVVTRTDLFRTIACGIGGTAMPMWKGSIEDKDIWAIAYFVDSLIKMNGTPAAAELRKKLLTQPEFVPPEGAAPAPAPEEEKKPEEKK